MRFKLLFVLILFFAFLIYGCSNATSLELKTKSIKQELSQVTTIGTEIGNTPPDFVVITTEGKAVRLKDFIEQKKPLIVYFMATWCPWCAKDYTALSKVYKDYENNVGIVSISLDLSENLIELKKYKEKYPELKNTFFASGQSEMLVNYKVTKTTTKYAIDKNGKIIYAGFGAFNEEQWKTLLDALLK